MLQNVINNLIASWSTKVVEQGYIFHLDRLTEDVSARDHDSVQLYHIYNCIITTTVI